MCLCICVAVLYFNICSQLHTYGEGVIVVTQSFYVIFDSHKMLKIVGGITEGICNKRKQMVRTGKSNH